ncbi:MAG: 4Fe-4S binding protein [Saprospiraceae bacterium]|nr:4Fe-4S binding protein [Saprospiraceae bacterium]MCB9320497.1 4Fe-4S binding protein [Lewinellaceae bacterium]
MKDISLARQKWLELEMTISEGLCISDSLVSTGYLPSGRQVQINGSGDLAYVLGLSSGGLRAAAWLDPDDNPLPVLQQAVRQLLPMVVVADATLTSPLVESGAFVLQAGSLQELIDYTLIAHRVSEQALVPGVILFTGNPAESCQIPDAVQARQFLGEADDRIPSPGEAQQLLFGKHRRRIPRVFHLDIPVLSGAAKSTAGLAYETAAREAYFAAAVDDFLNAAREEFASMVGRKYQPLKANNTDRQGILVVSNTPDVWSEVDAVKLKSRIIQVDLHQLHPIPLILKRIGEKAGAVVTIEPFASGSTALATMVRAGLAHLPVPFYSACFAHSPEPEALGLFMRNVESHQVHQQTVWLDIPYSIEHSRYPKKQVLMQDVRRAYPHLVSPAPSKKGDQVRMPDRVPMILRKSRDLGPAFAKASHFFDTTAFFYEGSDEWTADPFQAFPVMPPATAAFGQEIMDRQQLPGLDTSRCTGCGECLIHCPHSALPSLVAGVESLLQTGIQLAQGKGQVINQLFPLIKNLAKVTNTYLSEHHQDINGQTAALTLADVLAPSFEEFLTRGRYTEEKENGLRQEFTAILDTVGHLPIVITGRFFNEGNKELFSLMVDPGACTGCAICSAACPESALQLHYETPALHDLTRKNISLWEHMPDTSGDTIQRLIEDPNHPSLAALMLSRNFYESLAGASDPGNPGVKTMIHLVAAVAEATGQQNSRNFIRQLDALQDAVKAQLKSELNRALPELDAANLSRTLEQVQTAHLTLDELLGQNSGKKTGQLLDKSVLQRKSTLLRQLEDLRDVIDSGTSGLGRSRYAIALDDSLKGLSAFPVNSFTVPVMSFSGSTPTMALGLIRAHVRHLLDNIKILRRAELEQKNQYNPIIHDPQIARLSWQDLTEAEKKMAPPLLLIARQSFLTRQSTNPLTQLLAQGLPVKVFLLDDVTGKPQTASSYLGYNSLSMIPFLGLGAVQVGQHSLADAEHLFNGLISAFGKPGAAILRLLAPELSTGNPQRMHQLANDARAWIHLDYLPDRHSHLMISRLHLRNNPASENDWTRRAILYGSEDKAQSLDYEVTPADWYFEQPGYREGFSPHEGEKGNGLPVAEYLRLDPDERPDQVPVILRVDHQGALVRYKVPAVVVDACEAAARAWRLLREISGELTEFPEKLQTKVETDLKIQFEADKAALILEHEKQIQELEAVHLEKMRMQIKSRLMQMAGWKE